MKSGFVGLIGRPNVGKSTLVNAMVGKKVAITSDKPQTTRNLIQGIYHGNDTQIVFIDTPGIHKPTHALEQTLNREAYYTLDDADIILVLVDASLPLGGGDKYIIDRLQNLKKPVILVLNKIDKLTKEDIYNKISEYNKLYDFTEIVPVSALKHDNLKELIKVIESYLPDKVKYYDDDTTTNKPLDFLMAEIIREKVLLLTDKEVPYAVACLIDTVETSRTLYKIHASIIVERESLKHIIIGKGGSKIKEIGTLARHDIEALLNKRVYLELQVKTVENWRDQEKYLKAFGYNDLSR